VAVALPDLPKVLVAQAVAATEAKTVPQQHLARLIPVAAVVAAGIRHTRAVPAAPVSSFFATKSLSRLLFRPSHLPAHSRLRLASPRLSTLWWRVAVVVVETEAAVAVLAASAQGLD